MPTLHSLNINRSNKNNGFTLKKQNKESRWYPAETITDAYDLALLTNASAQAESLPHSLELAAGGSGLHVNANHVLNEEVSSPL